MVRMKKRSFLKRWTWMACLVAGLALLFACPLTASAADTVQYIDENGAVQELMEYYTPEDYSASGTGEMMWNKEGEQWLVVSEDITYEEAIRVSSKATIFNLVLCDGVTLTAKKGIQLSCQNFNIYSSSLGENMGKLIATSSSEYPRSCRPGYRT